MYNDERAGVGNEVTSLCRDHAVTTRQRRSYENGTYIVKSLKVFDYNRFWKRHSSSLLIHEKIFITRIIY